MEQVKNSTKTRMNVKSQMGFGDGLNEMRDSSMSRKNVGWFRFLSDEKQQYEKYISTPPWAIMFCDFAADQSKIFLENIERI